MNHEEKTISILKQAGQIKPDYNRFTDFISQMNVTVPLTAGQTDTGRNLKVKFGRVSSFWALGQAVFGTTLLILIAFVVASSNQNLKTSYVIDKAIMDEQDAVLYEELLISLDDGEVMAYLNSPKLNEFDQINYEIENI
ncbi:hypothetical protein A3B93_00225 [Candidatus Nomurabacteria bacterium RIFCSPHIGHO2_02_FULL_42_24]|uniref:Uncharacterized protein n=1 Tax=Candidatus Nomurabacteria bacterium RIFCSPHIGHO2_02_FULL_42_24 TaxID=1801757 RepID=A0A1F6WHE2_9BACT|nr:MAG: hypothetical protein UV08_C0038G0007 [Parcubacteria group bacterium GW2011_GWA2_42_18]OGI81313.1 MAG: hypothetical protein A3B93_00225 [Candidatus Nomurabacteria bacterium RIFCSPHIGHO2_02_FULL_42_24]